ncbi:hypothetical protein CPC08DRAFT_637173 [Agrocybe pediades]|nr:hypothetical protein CPC08DRAFT_637173 [Agrocybe pediades]
MPTSTTTKLLYFVAPKDGDRAWLKINANPETGIQEKSFTREEKDVVVENIRGKERIATIDTAGFQFASAPAKHTSFMNDEEIVKEYYPESIELLKKLTGASRVVLFDHTIRRRRPGMPDDHPSRRQPVAFAHVDQTAKSAIGRVHRHLPAEEVPELLKKRFQIINLWRPINLPALDWPLGLCDYRSVSPAEDTVPVALLYDDHEGETLSVKYNPAHKWYYMYNMTPEEVVIIKCFDSLQNGSVAVFTPHSAFQDPTTPEGTPLRESIELRALVFYD